MIEKDRVDRRAFLNQLSTPQLEEIIRKDIDSEGSDNQEVIFEILSILKERDETKVVDTDTAWQEFKEHYNTSEGEGLSLYPEAGAAKKKNKKFIGLRKFVAAAAAVIMLICAVPPAMGADNIVELFAHWTSEKFTFLNSEQEPIEEYKFIYSTDNPELQEIHDAAQELGVTENVVPSWIPDGFEMIELKVYESSSVTATFGDSEKSIVFDINVFEDAQMMGYIKYEKDETEVETVEINGIEHYIMKNTNHNVVVWTVDNVECVVSASLEKEELLKIIRSVYEEIK